MFAVRASEDDVICHDVVKATLSSRERQAKVMQRMNGGKYILPQSRRRRLGESRAGEFFCALRTAYSDGVIFLCPRNILHYRRHGSRPSVRQLIHTPRFREKYVIEKKSDGISRVSRFCETDRLRHSCHLLRTANNSLFSGKIFPLLLYVVSVNVSTVIRSFCDVSPSCRKKLNYEFFRSAASLRGGRQRQRRRRRRRR